MKKLLTKGILFVVFVMIFFIIGYWGLNIGTGIFFQGQDNQIPSEARIEYTIDKKIYFVSGFGGVYKNGLKIKNFEMLAGKNFVYKQLFIIPLFGIQYFNIQYLNGKTSVIIPTLAIESALKILEHCLPIASFLVIPVMFSAALLNEVILQFISTVKTPSAILSSMIRYCLSNGGME